MIKHTIHFCEINHYKRVNKSYIPLINKKCLSIIKYELRKTGFRPLARWVLDLWVNKGKTQVCQLSYLPRIILSYPCACTSVQYQNTVDWSYGQNWEEKKSCCECSTKEKNTRKKDNANISKNQLIFCKKREDRKQTLSNPFSIINCLKKLKTRIHLKD